jgi:predicted branched-subunit amino acid permease
MSTIEATVDAGPVVTEAAERRTATRTGSRGAALAGARDMLPLLLGILPFAVVIGVTVHRAAIDHLAGWAGSLLLFGGIAQLTAVELLDKGVAPLVIVGTVVLINSRFVLYSAALAEWFRHEPRRRRLWLAFPLVDQLYVVCTERFAAGDLDRAQRRAYYVGGAMVLAVGWVTTQGIATLFAASIPSPELLQIAAPLAFVGLLAATVKDRAALVAALVAGAAALAGPVIPSHLGLLAAIVLGVLVGGLVDRSTS